MRRGNHSSLDLHFPNASKSVCSSHISTTNFMQMAIWPLKRKSKLWLTFSGLFRVFGPGSSTSLLKLASVVIENPPCQSRYFSHQKSLFFRDDPVYFVRSEHLPTCAMLGNRQTVVRKNWLQTNELGLILPQKIQELDKFLNQIEHRDRGYCNHTVCYILKEKPTLRTESAQKSD